MTLEDAKDQDLADELDEKFETMRPIVSELVKRGYQVDFWWKSIRRESAGESTFELAENSGFQVSKVDRLNNKNQD